MQVHIKASLDASPVTSQLRWANVTGLAPRRNTERFPVSPRVTHTPCPEGGMCGLHPARKGGTPILPGKRVMRGACARKGDR